MTEQHSLDTDHILIAAAIAQQHGFYEMQDALHFLAKTTVFLEHAQVGAFAALADCAASETVTQ